MKKRDIQFHLPGFANPSSRQEHGGNVRYGMRKTARPLGTRTTIHVVMRSSRAVGAWSFLTKTNREVITEIMRKQARRHGVRVERWVNVGNHLHICIRATRREGLQNFLRTVPALIARAITGAHRGSPISTTKENPIDHRGPKGSLRVFWDGPVYTRIFNSSFSQWKLREYIRANAIEIGRGRWARDLFLAERRGLFPPPLEEEATHSTTRRRSNSRQWIQNQPLYVSKAKPTTLLE